ncbi:unnamed protein product [Sphagnum troendelagicum]|uniref:Uncharacterized protein n=1 Tax=Sphagnum troendelagicum TaxID=128251 RepID=A0ABP0TIP7_9BRYO
MITARKMTSSSSSCRGGGFSLSRTLRVSLPNNFSPRKWWTRAAAASNRHRELMMGSSFFPLTPSSSSSSAEDMDRSAYQRLEPAADGDENLSVHSVTNVEDLTSSRTQSRTSPQTAGSAEITAAAACEKEPDGVDVVIRRHSLLKLLSSSPTALLARLRESYTKLRETAGRTSVTVAELFVGNQMLMHVTATPVAGRKKLDAMPSKGFIDHRNSDRVKTLKTQSTVLER